MSKANLNDLRAELVTDMSDIDLVESVLSRFHPLGHKRAMGRRLYYAVTHQGEWQSVLLFDMPARKNKHRKRVIGWSNEQEKERVKHIACNSRYCIANKASKVKNLASKSLKLVTDRISSDWYNRYGVPLLALETFVDPEHNDNSGTCYTAAGWTYEGITTGYQQPNQERSHGKMYFMKALHKDSYKALSSDVPHALLTGAKPVDKKSNNNYILDTSKIDLSALKRDIEKTVSDPRSQQGQRYPLAPFLSMCICAVISGHTQYTQIADWISSQSKELLAKVGMPVRHTPEASTISKILRRVDPKQLNKALSKWLLKTYGKKIDVVSLDGKELRGTSSSRGERVSVLNVYANELGITLDQRLCKKGGGEKAVARAVIEENEHIGEDTILLTDAQHCDAQFVESAQKKKPSI